MEQENINTSQPDIPKRRPVFLTVLCIFSFVGVGIAFFSALILLFLNSTENPLMFTHHSNHILGNIIDNPDDYMHMKQISGIVGLIAAMACLAGVLLMWKLKKVGYFIYIIGEIVPPITAIALSGHSGYSEMFSSLYMVLLNLSFIHPIAFIIMYGVNLKHMT